MTGWPPVTDAASACWLYRLAAEVATLRAQVADAQAVASRYINNGSGNTPKDRAERQVGVEVLQALMGIDRG